MSVSSREVLAPDSGQHLPAAVRRTLVDLGVATNHAALAVAQAALLEVQCLAVEEGEQAARGQATNVTETAAMLAQCALQYHEQLVVGYTVIAARYAVYAARVAADVTSDRQIADVDVTGILPSQLIERLDQRLPPLRFPTQRDHPTVAEDQNDAITEARDHLDTVIQRQMFGSAVTEYDTVDTAPRPKGSQDLVVGFPQALHDYAAAVTWAVGVFTNFGQPATR
jgi:hypothetical protein